LTIHKLPPYLFAEYPLTAKIIEEALLGSASIKEGLGYKTRAISDHIMIA
jgi:hypothetical protein